MSLKNITAFYRHIDHIFPRKITAQSLCQEIGLQQYHKNFPYGGTAVSHFSIDEMDQQYLNNDTKIKLSYPNYKDESDRFIDLNRYGNALLAQGAFGEVSLAIDKGVSTPQSSHDDGVETKFTRVRYAAIKTIQKAFVISSSSTKMPLGGLSDLASSWGFAASSSFSSSANNHENPPKYQLTKEVFCEITALRLLTNTAPKHPCITPLLSVFPTPSTHGRGGLSSLSLSLAFPYCPAALSDIISHRKASSSKHHLSISILRVIFWDMLSAVSHCHSRGIMHRDIKPGNFLVGQNNHIQLTDFGLAKAFDPSLYRQEAESKASMFFATDNNDNNKSKTNSKKEDLQQTEEIVEEHDNIASPSHAIGTLHYLAPEKLYGSKHCKPSMDIFSLALVFAECINLHPFIPGINTMDQMSKMFRILGTPGTETNWPKARLLPDFNKVRFQQWNRVENLYTVIPRLKEDDIYTFPFRGPNENDSRRGGLLHELIYSMLELDPMKRPNAVDCLEHSWFFTRNPVLENDNVTRQLLLQELVEKEWMEPEVICISTSEKKGEESNEFREVKRDALQLVKVRKELLAKWNGGWGGGVLSTMGQPKNDKSKEVGKIQCKLRATGLMDILRNQAKK